MVARDEIHNELGTDAIVLLEQDGQVIGIYRHPFPELSVGGAAVDGNVSEVRPIGISDNSIISLFELLPSYLLNMYSLLTVRSKVSRICSAECGVSNSLP